MATTTEVKRPRGLRRRGKPRSKFLVPVTLLSLIGFAIVLGPWVFSLPDPNLQVLADARLAPGSEGHLLGTDGLGRDVLARLLEGGRISFIVGFMSVSIGLVVGGTLGILAGYMGGVVDAVISRIVEILLAFPVLILALSVATFLGPSVRNVILAISFYTIPAYVRLSRASAYRVRGSDFIVAASLAGAGTPYILRKHVAPLVIQTLIAYGLLAMGTAIIVEASLSFLGLGVVSPQATWGTMLADGKSELDFAAHIAFAPAVALFLTVLSLNLLGEALRTRADQKVGAA